MRLRACAAGMLLVAVAGCWFARPTVTSTWLDRLRPFNGPAGADVIVLDIAILETPVGEKYINQELWTGTDELFLSPELRSLHEDNGLRVAMIHGRAPEQFQAMLTNERYNRNARQRRFRAGESTQIDVGSQRERCRLELKTDGRPQLLQFEQALCQLQVTPSLGSDDKVHLQIIPQLQHHDKNRTPALSGASLLSLQNHRVTEPYPALKFDVALSANECVVVGTRFDKPSSLGFQFFVQAEGNRPAQRLLVLRAARGSTGSPALPTSKSDPAANGKLSLASQVARGQ